MKIITDYKFWRISSDELDSKLECWHCEVDAKWLVSSGSSSGFFCSLCKENIEKGKLSPVFVEYKGEHDNN